jgi:hypothetical protein
MYCPQCGTESQSTLQYCRVCGANLKVIGKAVSLSEAIARSDRGPLPKIREMVKGLKVEHVTDEVSRALERMNNEIALISPESKPRANHRPWINLRKKKTPEERREDHITKGVVSLFSGIGLTVFLYFLSAALVLKLPPRIIEQIPFEIEPVVRIIWLLGLLPALSGFGHIIAGLLIRPQRPQALDPIDFPSPEIKMGAPTTAVHGASVTEHTTELLEHESSRKPNHM